MEPDPFDTEDFYELMQAYRHAPLSDQGKVLMAFEAVKIFCKNEVNKARDVILREWLKMKGKAH